jgi:hypothetical protein
MFPPGDDKSGKGWVRLGVAGWAILGAPIAAHASWHGLEKLEENCISMDLYGFFSGFLLDLWISTGLLWGFFELMCPAKVLMRGRTVEPSDSMRQLGFGVGAEERAIPKC